MKRCFSGLFVAVFLLSLSITAVFAKDSRLLITKKEMSHGTNERSFR